MDGVRIVYAVHQDGSCLEAIILPGDTRLSQDALREDGPPLAIYRSSDLAVKHATAVKQSDPDDSANLVTIVLWTEEA